jgi:hypothetical protein
VTTSVSNTLDSAREYTKRGWSVLPIPRGEKGPRIENWPNLRLAETDLPAHFDNSQNIGVILGAASGALVDVDSDSPEAVLLADSFLPATGFIFGRTSKRGSHHFYSCDPLPEPRKFCDIDGSCIIELRSNGQQTVVPPSLHPSGELYICEQNGEPARVDGVAVAQAVERVASAALMARHWPALGYRHDASLALAGMLIHGGWTEDEAAPLIEAVATASHDEETRVRVRNVTSTEKRIAAGKGAAGGPTLAGIIGADVVKRAREWLGLDSRNVSASSPTGWPIPAPLGDELLPVPPFDLELLPTSLRPLVADISDRMQAPSDYAAAAAIVALAGCVNRRAVIMPKQEDKSWHVVPNLWGAIVAPPGMMKSPILRAMTLPLVQIEEKWRVEFENEYDNLEIEKEQKELRWQAWREQYKQAVKKGEEAPIQPDKTLRSPVQRRLVLTDATFEKLHEILAQNPAGVLVVRDELTGWLSELGRLGREGERAFFLQAWNGDAGFTVDRIGRGSIHVPAVCVSLIGNIQPARLRAYLSDAIEGGPTDDGLFQRFQILVWPDLPGRWQLVDRPANLLAFQIAERVFSMLAELPADDPVHICFSPEAQQLFFEWWHELEEKVRGDSGLAPPLVAHLAKYRSLMPSLAGLFELADLTASGNLSSKEISISVEHAKQGAALCDFFEFHARRIYASLISPQMRSARELARHIKSGDLPSVFTTRSVYVKGWASLDKPERVRGALALLKEADWICRAEPSPSPTGGRPPEMWIVNPKVNARAQ